jgi:hypothetical protein
MLEVRRTIKAALPERKTRSYASSGKNLAKLKINENHEFDSIFSIYLKTNTQIQQLINEYNSPYHRIN